MPSSSFVRLRRGARGEGGCVDMHVFEINSCTDVHLHKMLFVKSSFKTNLACHKSRQFFTPPQKKKKNTRFGLFLFTIAKYGFRETKVHVGLWKSLR